MALDPEVTQLLGDALDDAENWEDVRRSLEAAELENKETRLRPFVFAFAYPLLERQSGRRDRAGEPYGAMVAGTTDTGDPWRFPPAVSDVDVTDVEAWADAFDAFDHPLARARLGDLLWERKWTTEAHQKARLAADAFVELSRREGRLMERAVGLSRGLELARMVKDEERQATVVQATLEFIEADLASEEGGPGVSLLPLRTLLALPPAERPPSLDDLLVKVDEKYGADPHIADDVAELRAQMLDADGRELLRSAQIERWRKEADAGDMMLKVNRLEHALELATAHGFTSEADAIRAELGAIHPDDLDLKRISTEIKLPQEEIDRFLSLFRDAPSWQDALQRLAAQPPPGGAPEALAERVAEQMEQMPLQYLVTKQVIGPDNASSIFVANTPESHLRLALAEDLARAARFWSIFAADALDAIRDAFDRPTRDELTEFFSSEMIQSGVGERVARAVEFYWDGEYDECAHLLVPRLERAFRDMARQTGIPVMREPRGEQAGGVSTFGTVLRDLKGVFRDSGWHEYFVNLLVDQLGLNLRNVVCHGLSERVGRGDAALLIQVAVLLSTLRFVEPVTDPL